MYDDVISAPNPSRQRRRKRRAAARGTTQVAADTADKAVETESNYLEEAVNTNATISNQENPDPECPKENLACAHAHTQTDICCPNYDLSPSSHNLPSHNFTATNPRSSSRLSSTTRTSSLTNLCPSPTKSTTTTWTWNTRWLMWTDVCEQKMEWWRVPREPKKNERSTAPAVIG